MLTSKPHLSRTLSFNTETGEPENQQKFFEGSTWKRLEKSRGKLMERSNSFVGSSSTSAATQTDAIIVVDPFSTGNT